MEILSFDEFVQHGLAHADNVVRCAAAGLHIFCEKPLALSLEDCNRAISAASECFQGHQAERW